MQGVRTTFKETNPATQQAHETSVGAKQPDLTVDALDKPPKSGSLDAVQLNTASKHFEGFQCGHTCDHKHKSQ